MVDTIVREFTFLWHYFVVQFNQIFIYWLIGIIIGSLISVFAKDKIHNLFAKMNDKKLGIVGIFIASFLGILSPLCMYGTIPIAASFTSKGMREDYLGAFMVSSILLNPQLLIYSAALGTTALLIRFNTSLLCGFLAGLLLRIFYRKKSFFNFTKLTNTTNRDTDLNKLLRLLKNILRNIKATGPYFLIGIILTALFQRYVPDDLVVMFFGGNEAFGVLMAATLGVPVYVCGGGTIPLLQEWLNKGMSMGSATAFMITGPATKITNLGALKIVLGLKNFLIYLSYIVLFSLFSGLIIDLVI